MKGGKSLIWKIPLAFGVIAMATFAGAMIARNSVYTEAKVGTFIHNGVWYTDNFGGEDATPLTRAYAAVVGLLALSRKETVYYLAHTDEAGEPISSDNVYEIVGDDLPARWWSITLYDADQFLTPNAEGKYSVRSTDMIREPDGSFRVILSRQKREGNWIPMGEGQNMSLVLRMYNPDPQALDRLADIDLPLIRKVEE